MERVAQPEKIEESPKPFTFLVLADIHFGQLADSPEFRINGMNHGTGSVRPTSRRDGLIAEVRKLAEKPTAIFVPGDLTSIASPGEFAACVEMTLGIAKELGVDRSNVYFTYGNHDTNWRICELGIEAGGHESDPAYNHVASNIGSLYAPVENCVEKGPVVGSGVFRAGDHTVFVLNSGFFCIAEQTHRHGRLGNDQLKWLEKALEQHSSVKGWRLLMVHHHPFNYRYPTPINDVSCIEEGAEVVELAGKNGVHFLFHGHRHHPRLFTEMQTDWKTPVTFFCGGSVAVGAHHRDTGLIPNLFHVVSLKKLLKSGAAFGNVTSFEFTSDGWKPVQHSAATPLDHVHWFGALFSDAENDGAIRAFLNDFIGTAPPPTIMLPSREHLPEGLMCCSLERLNGRLAEIAPEFGFRIVGKYPDSVALIKL